MTILYFTATGNSYVMAKRMNGKMVSIPQAIRQKKYEFQDDALGFVFPVFGLCVPPLILDFIKNAHFQCKYFFAVLTYGFYAGAACEQLKKAGKMQGIQFSYINSIKMVENYIPGFSMKKEVNKHTGPQVEDRMNQIAKEIQDGKIFVKKNSLAAKFLTSCHLRKYAYPLGKGFSEQYQSNGKCCSCVVCEKVCPMGNIQLTDGKPVFGTQCMSCLACIQNCPAGAIHLKSEKDGVRYRNPQVSLDEIIQANHQNEDIHIS